MIEVISVLLWLVVATIMATFGAVLIIHFVKNSSSTVKQRTALAALVGPVSVIAPLMMLMFGEDSDWAGELFGIGIVSAGAVLILGWPIAHFATRKLNRLAGMNLETFR